MTTTPKGKQLVSKDLYEGKETKLMLTKSSPISSEQVLQIFQKTPKKHIYQRPAKGGGQWDYVTGVYVKKVLNYVFGWLWSFQIVDKAREGDLVWVQGRLTINNPKTFEPIIIKEQFGRAEVKFKKGTKIPLDYGNDLKAAATDALKKCASELGIASDVYGASEFKEVGIEDDSTNVAPPPKNAIAKEYECHESACEMSEAEYKYSMRMFGRPYCLLHQKGRRKKTTKNGK